jgi:glycosyltransferase involved in cell wall biosynthesis
MRCPTLTQLPPPPAGKTGWPWTEETPQPRKGEAGDQRAAEEVTPWPLVSVVTPSYKQGQFIEETIRSVLLQGYPNLEYIIIDGGSTDGTLEVIRKYESWLSYWISESDRGQSHAINKGFARCSGELMGWLNSDDIYLMGTIHKIVQEFRARRDAHLVYGDALCTDKESQPLWVFKSRETSLLAKLEYWRGWYIAQPAVFFKRDLYLHMGALEEAFHYALDYDYFLRAAFHYRFHYVPGVLATYRRHAASKTGHWESQKVLFHTECKQAVARYVKFNTSLYWQWKLRYALRGPLALYRRTRRGLLNTFRRGKR